MKRLEELTTLATRCNSMSAIEDLNAAYVNFITNIEPGDIVAIAEAFDQIKKRAEAAEAIVADVEEVIGLLAEREWAEHCTKTDTGKRLEEAITELHNEATPADVPAPPVFGYMRVVSGQSFQIMEGTQRPPDRSGNGAGPWFAIYRQPPAPAPAIPAEMMDRIALNFYPNPPEQPK